MILKEQTTEKKNQLQLRDVKQSNKELYSMIAFRVTNEQMHKLKLEAVKEKRSMSNYIKTKLF
jgi:hypothetical protein